MTIKDNLFTGLLSGLMAPVVTFSIYTKIKFPEETILNVLHHITEIGILSTVISLSVFINLLVFFLFLWSKNDHSAKGVLAATFLYAFLVAVLKLAS